MQLPILLLLCTSIRVSQSILTPIDISLQLASCKACETRTFNFTSPYEREPWQTPRLDFRYNKTFGSWVCEFFSCHSDQEFAFLSRCVKGEIIATDGVYHGKYKDQKKVFHLYYDMTRNQQQLIIEDVEAPPTANGSRRLQVERDDVIYDRRTDVNEHRFKWKGPKVVTKSKDAELENPFKWKGPKEITTTKDAELEIAVDVDHEFVEFCNGKIDEAEKLAHQLVNAAHAMFKPVKLNLFIVHFRVLNETTSKDLIAKASNRKEYLIAMMAYYDELVVQLDLKRANLSSDNVRGGPDAILTLTNHRFGREQGEGVAIHNTLCSLSAHAVVNLPRLDESSNTVWGGKFPRCAMLRMTADIVAHELGHIIGLYHEGMDCGCQTDHPEGVCIMFSASDPSSYKWSNCSETFLINRIRPGIIEGDCLYYKDVFKDAESVLVPESSVVQMEESSQDNNPTLVLKSRYFPEVTIRLRLRIVLQDGKDCFFYHNQKDEPFAAFFYCDLRDVKWVGVFHMNHMTRVSLHTQYEKGFWQHVVTLSKLDKLSNMTASSEPITGPQVPGKPVIRAIIAMDSLFLNATGGKSNGTRHIVNAVNIADATFRRIGMTLVIAGFQAVKDSDSYESYQNQANEILKRRKGYVFILFTGADIQELNHTTRRQCVDNGVAILKHQSIPIRQALDLAHEVGHYLGLGDEEENNCVCRTPLGVCVMNPYAQSRGNIWSTCSVNWLRSLNGSDDVRCFQKIGKHRSDQRKATVPTHIVVLRIFVAFFTVVLVLLLCFEFCKLMYRSPHRSHLFGRQSRENRAQVREQRPRRMSSGERDRRSQMTITSL